jgi:ribosomal protein L16 Arg81 hydroxylase
MPPRGQHQLDEISQKLGELTAYTHEHRHGVNNLSQKFDALALDVARRVEALDTKMTLRTDEIHRALTAENVLLQARVKVLEDEKSRREGAMGAVNWLLRNWPIILGFLTLVAVILAANGKLP